MVQLFFSTNLLPDYDLSIAMSVNFPIPTCLHSSCCCQTSVDSRCHLLFDKQHNHTWALCHGTTVKTAQLEGKIRPANWSYHKNQQRCHLPTFGAFYLGEKSPMLTKRSQPGQKRPFLIPWRKRARANRMSLLARCLEYRGSDEHIAFKAGDNEKAQLGVGDKGIVNTSEKYTIAHSKHIALKWADLKGPRRIEKTQENRHW